VVRAIEWEIAGSKSHHTYWMDELTTLKKNNGNQIGHTQANVYFLLILDTVFTDNNWIKLFNVYWQIVASLLNDTKTLSKNSYLISSCKNTFLLIFYFISSKAQKKKAFPRHFLLNFLTIFSRSCRQHQWSTQEMTHKHNFLICNTNDFNMQPYTKM